MCLASPTCVRQNAVTSHKQVVIPAHSVMCTPGTHGLSLFLQRRSTSLPFLSSSPLCLAQKSRQSRFAATMVDGFIHHHSHLVTLPAFLLWKELSAHTDRSSGRTETTPHITHHTPGHQGHNPSNYIPQILAATLVHFKLAVFV